MIWCNLFTYKEGVLYWKNPACTRIYPGDVAGCKHHRGYWHVVAGKKHYMRHRIVWEMHNGAIPEGMEIDHVNHVPGDDRIENLRLVTRVINCRNKLKPSTNTSGAVGVTWNKKTGKWRAQIKMNGKTKYLYYGDSFEEALKARKAADVWNGFHESHGSNKNSTNC